MGVIVITGGSRGIGASAAEQAAQRGMGVILTYNANPQAAASVVERIKQAGGKAVALKLDVADVSSFGAFRESVVQA
ncbi:SDR family NAD(P)-dependent oxidoreductase, partial [Pseudomonas syringae]